jgi:hypothetical protein
MCRNVEAACVAAQSAVRYTQVYVRPHGVGAFGQPVRFPAVPLREVSGGSRLRAEFWGLVWGLGSDQDNYLNR